VAASGSPRNVLVGPYVQFYTGFHPLDARERIKGPKLTAPITVAENVWLGGGVILCPGVTVGANTTLGAGSGVTKDVPAGVLAAGNPCRVIRRLEQATTGSGDRGDDALRARIWALISPVGRTMVASDFIQSLEMRPFLLFPAR
jgi:hypothetical protein